MPGIYGLNMRDNSMERDDMKRLFSSMRDILHHRDDYITKENTQECYMVGKKYFASDPWAGYGIYEVEDQYIIFIDGEVFSYEDEKGHHEITDRQGFILSLVRNYQKHGVLQVGNVNGEFVISLYDKRAKSLIIVNDRWGMRELYYYIDKDICIFSSEIKAILKYTKYHVKIDEKGVADFLNFGYFLGNKTFFKEINLLPPGSILIVDGEKYTIHANRFTLKPSLPANNFDEYVDKTYELLNKAVVNRVRGRKTIASYLTGGLDSRLVTGILSQNVSKVDTFTISQHEKGKEYLIALEVVKKLINCTNSMGKASPDHVGQYLPWAVHLTEGMMMLGAVSPFYAAMHDHLKAHDVLLGGFAGNMIMGGLFMSEEHLKNTYTMQERMDLMGNISDARLMKPFIPMLIHDNFKEKYSYLSGKNLEEQYDYLADKTDEFVFQFDLFVLMGRYRRGFNANRGLLGHFTVEEYYPLIDIELFDFMYSLPPKIRFDYKLYKALYKKYFPELAEITWLQIGKSLTNEKVSFLEKRWRQFLFKMKWHIETKSLGKINIPDRANYADHA